MNTYTFWVEMTLRVPVQANSEEEAQNKIDAMAMDKMIEDCEQFELEANLITEN